VAGLVCWYLLTLDSHASLLLLLFPPVYREGGGPFTLGDYAVGDASFEALLDQLAGLYTPAASPAAAAAVEALPRLPVPPAPGGPDAPEPHEVYAVVTPGEACPVCHDEMAPGALVVQLPCAGGHTGGRLVVRHKGASFWHNSEKVCLGVGWWWGLRIHDQQTMSSGGCGGSAGSCTSISAYQLEHTGSSTLDQPRSTEP